MQGEKVELEKAIVEVRTVYAKKLTELATAENGRIDAQQDPARCSPLGHHNETGGDAPKRSCGGVFSHQHSIWSLASSTI